MTVNIVGGCLQATQWQIPQKNLAINKILDIASRLDSYNVIKTVQF